MLKLQAEKDAQYAAEIEEQDKKKLKALQERRQSQLKNESEDEKLARKLAEEQRIKWQQAYFEHAKPIETIVQKSRAG